LPSFLAIKIEIEFHANRSSDKVAVQFSFFGKNVSCRFDDSKAISISYNYVRKVMMLFKKVKTRKQHIWGAVRTIIGGGECSYIRVHMHAIKAIDFKRNQ
jgi:hypothetical protein